MQSKLDNLRMLTANTYVYLVNYKSRWNERATLEFICCKYKYLSEEQRECIRSQAYLFYRSGLPLPIEIHKKIEEEIKSYIPIAKFKGLKLKIPESDVDDVIKVIKSILG